MLSGENSPVTHPPERFEQLIAFIGSQLPSPVEQQSGSDGSIIFTGGDPAEAVVLLAASRVVVFEFAGVWETPSNFVAKPRRLGTLNWRRLPETALMNALTWLIKGARETRLARYRTCDQCGKRLPPESMVADDLCWTCAEQPGGDVA